MVLENCIVVVSSHACDPPVYYSAEYTIQYSAVQLYFSSISAHRVCVLWNSSELKCYQIIMCILAAVIYNSTACYIATVLGCVQ